VGGPRARKSNLKSARRTPAMPTADDALAKVQQAETGGQLSGSAAANIRRWLTEPPFARYRDRLVRDINAAAWPVLDDAFYAVLEFGTGGRRGKMYPVGTNVLNDRTIAESARATEVSPTPCIGVYTIEIPRSWLTDWLTTAAM
jgi:hypothetical protein